MNLVAVTGAAGMIGSRVVEQLSRQGRCVRVMQHSAAVHALDCQVVIGDLRSDESLRVLLNGVNTVVHCAAEMHDEMRMHEVNVLATERLARMAAELGVRCFIHLSSAGVIGPANSPWIDETSPCHPLNAYEVSKWESEQRLAALSDSSMRICIMRPTNVIDDGCPGVLVMALHHRWRDKMALLTKGNEFAHLVHAKEVAGAAQFLTENGTCSGVYFVGCDEDDRNTIKDVFNLTRKYMGLDGYHGPVLPASIPYCLRCMRRGKSLHGRTRFSSARLIGTGFEFPLGLDMAVERVCAWNRLKQ